MVTLGRFTVDCTPPVGAGIGLGVDEKANGIRDSLLLRGVMLSDDNKRCAIVTIDFAGLMNSAHDQLVESVASAANIPVTAVFIHCIHQHDAPLLNFEMEHILATEAFPRYWWDAVLKKTAASVKAAFAEMIPVSSVGYAEKRLHGYASNRRILGLTGQVEGMRFSKCGDIELKQRPVGTIDPFLRTIAFGDSNQQIIASLSMYATHPQVANGRKMFSGDAPGEAVRLVEEQFSGTFPCFFTGLGGNVTAGKYSSPTDLEDNLNHFGGLLADGIAYNLNSLQWKTCSEFQLQTASFSFPRSPESDKIQQSPDSNEARISNAVLQSCYDYAENENYHLRMLSIGPVSIMFFPGEPFVEYQLYMQSLIPDQFIAAVGNCSDNFLYLPLKKSFSEGGYEIEDYCWCNSQIEEKLKNAIQSLLIK